jgi:pilus assembly protein TadC
MTAALVIGWVATRLVPAAWRLAAGVLAVAAYLAPAPAAILALAAALVGWRGRLARSRRTVAAIDGELVVFADLVALGLTAGLPPRAAFEEAAGRVGPVLAAEVRAVVAAADRRGMAAALTDAQGHISRLCRLLARAVVSGAPAVDAVESYASERRHADHAARLAEARRLPVRLLLPLALLILPGFVVLAVGPAVIDAFERLGGAG